MAKKRKERILNPEPFVPEGTEYAKSKKTSKAARKHQQEGDLIDSHISSKIMKQALIQLKEVEDEDETNEQNVTRSSFNRLEEEPRKVEEDNNGDDIDDIDEFAGFDENQSQFGGFDVSHVSLWFLFCFVWMSWCCIYMQIWLF